MTGSGLQKQDKLLKRSDFVTLSKCGKSVSDRYFVVAFRKNASDRSRIGITVTKKTGNAVVRNRLKRIVREFYRLNKHRITGHWDINVIARKTAVGLPTKEAFASLEKLFRRIENDWNH